ncbi:Calmodulin-lysine N-methyltransferase protein [Dioscorea alata]|uniref:Calmodulin-lysine N-methyltransferase protein n=1 Tax=Dioscorea alata TaxID=55571 RepID=A0ACB7TUZ5_DIOAL|nr:Calmodulin-lysine N-methyltransferase protein [Dioscorea alata]
MRFTDSPAITLAIGGADLVFEQDNGSMHVGTSVWPCSLILAKFFDRWLSVPNPNPYAHLISFSGKRAVELGAGCGPAGLALTRLGLDVVLTDTAPVMPALRRNLKRNRPSLPRTPKIAQLYWNNQAQIQALKPPFDLVIAADVVYLEESVEALVSTMEQLVKLDGAVVLGYQLRSPEAHQLFWEVCGRVFPVIEKVPHEDLHPDYAYEETDLFILRKRK